MFLHFHAILYITHNILKYIILFKILSPHTHLQPIAAIFGQVENIIWCFPVIHLAKWQEFARFSTFRLMGVSLPALFPYHRIKKKLWQSNFKHFPGILFWFQETWQQHTFPTKTNPPFREVEKQADITILGTISLYTVIGCCTIAAELCYTVTLWHYTLVHCGRKRL